MPHRVAHACWMRLCIPVGWMCTKWFNDIFFTKSQIVLQPHFMKPLIIDMKVQERQTMFFLSNGKTHTNTAKQLERSSSCWTCHSCKATGVAINVFIVVVNNGSFLLHVSHVIVADTNINIMNYTQTFPALVSQSVLNELATILVNFSLFWNLWPKQRIKKMTIKGKVGCCPIKTTHEADI